MFSVSNLIFCLCIQVSLATDFMYNYMSRDVTASVGYDYILRQVIFVSLITKNFSA